MRQRRWAAFASPSPSERAWMLLACTVLQVPPLCSRHCCKVTGPAVFWRGMPPLNLALVLSMRCQGSFQVREQMPHCKA
jgi:hypothetical protein